MRKLLLTAVVAVAAALPASAAAAQTSIPGPHVALAPVAQTSSAVTYLFNRPDSGNGGNYWANDRLITRVLTLSLTGITGTGSARVYHYDAEVDDTGQAVAIPGQLTPNQGPGWTGTTIRNAVTAQMTGTAHYQFTASQPATFGFNSGVPFSETGAPKTTAEQTSFWYEQAFGPGTVFGGPGIGAWGWTYVVPVPPEQWVDSSANGGGNTPAAGNITG